MENHKVGEERMLYLFSKVGPRKIVAGRCVEGKRVSGFGSKEKQKGSTPSRKRNERDTLKGMNVLEMETESAKLSATTSAVKRIYDNSRPKDRRRGEREKGKLITGQPPWANPKEPGGEK